MLYHKEQVCEQHSIEKRVHSPVLWYALLHKHSHGIHWFIWSTFQKTPVLRLPQNIILGSTKWEALENKSVEFGVGQADISGGRS